MTYNKKTIEDISVSGKTVLVRCDFNVPMKDGKITSDKRIIGALPTIKYLLDNGAKVILCSHMGKPHSIFTEGFGLTKKEKKKVEELPENEREAMTKELLTKALGDKNKLTLKPVADRLNELLGEGTVAFAEDIIGADAKAKVAALEAGKAVLLENVRFDARETKNNPEFAKELAAYADIYVNGVKVGTLDGNKELHDSCRLFDDGSGSYDIVKKAVEYHKTKWDSSMGTKLTIAPENIEFLFEAVKNFINMGFTCINLNCIFEKGWELSHASILYEQLKLLADYVLEHDLFDKIYFSIFDEQMFYKLPEEETNNWCGGNGKMLALDWKGDYYPCIRYMESSLGTDIPPLKIGNIHQGIGTNEKEQAIINELKSITRQSQSTDECLNCPINAGCAWCSGYNY